MIEWILHGPCPSLLKNKFMLPAFAVCMFMQVSVVAFEPIRAIFKTAAMTGVQWMVVVMLSALPLVISEIEKISGRHLRKKA